jgi:peptidoglycan-N-acetylglucosamine deacetylase
MTRGTFTMVDNPVPWPNGARCAVSFTWDMDADSILHLAHPNDADTRLLTMTDLRFGPQVAVPRICRAFEAYGLKLTFFVPAWCIEQHPEAIERMLSGGHEIAHHGYMHELPNTFTKERERYWTERSFEVIERVTGKKPRGYRAPFGAYSKHSTEILANLAFLYDSSLAGDDVPYVIRDKKGRELIEIPVKWPLDDWPQYQHSIDLDYLMQISAPQRAKEVFMSEFDAAWKYNTFWQCVFHPFVSGRIPRLDSIMSMVEEMQDKGGVWFATMEEIANHVRGLIDRGQYTPRVQVLPITDGRISDVPDPAAER